jgi:hypothetical protein
MGISIHLYVGNYERLVQKFMKLGKTEDPTFIEKVMNFMGYHAGE